MSGPNGIIGNPVAAGSLSASSLVHQMAVPTIQAIGSGGLRGWLGQKFAQRFERVTAGYVNDFTARLAGC
ncbi:hypothetical protein BR1R5_20850 [Pseudomonas sp. BR1R-5]|nr:hypothetical protein BR1R5_20850 [Pseudomonas sp. BR1R-5]